MSIYRSHKHQQQNKKIQTNKQTEKDLRTSSIYLNLNLKMATGTGEELHRVRTFSNRSHLKIFEHLSRRFDYFGNFSVGRGKIVLHLHFDQISKIYFLNG